MASQSMSDRITGRTYLERGEPVVVLIRWSGKGPRNVLVERADGTRVVRPFRGLRRVVSHGGADGISLEVANVLTGAA